MQTLYRNNTEYQQHASAIHQLAHQYHENESIVRELYEKILADFLLEARFRRYLSILVSRKVVDRLNKDPVS